MNLRRTLMLVVRQSPRDLWSTLYALIAVMTVEVLVRLAPFSRVLRAFGIVLASEFPDRPARSAPVELAARETRHLRSLRRVMRYWPFANGPCLREALVAAHVLRRHHPVLVVGVARGQQPALAAHAWLEIEGQRLGDAPGFLRLQS